VQIIGGDLAPADRQPAHPPAQDELKEGQSGHGPVEHDGDRRIATFVGMPGRPLQDVEDQPIDHAARGPA
jgi:hypothetical protein